MFWGEYVIHLKHWKESKFTWSRISFQGCTDSSLFESVCNSRSVAWACHHLWPFKISSGGIGKPMQPCKLRPAVWSVHGICWGKGGTEIVGVVSQWWVEPETHATRVSLPLILPGVSQRPWEIGWKQTQLQKKNINIMTSNAILLYSNIGAYPVVTTPTSSSNWWKPMQRPIAKH